MDSLRFVIVVASLVVLSACATSRPVAGPANASPTSAVRIGHDAAFVKRVEQAALRRGIQVTWVHPPTRRPAVD